MDINQKQEIVRQMNDQGLVIPFGKSLAASKSSLEVYGKTISNRIGIQPLEGFDSDTDGTPSLITKNRYIRFVRSGAGLIWFEACAVSSDGKSNPHQMALTDDNVSAFRNLIEEMDRTSEEMNQKPVFKVLQLTHSGHVSRDSDWNPIPLGARKNAHEENLPDSELTHIATDERIQLMIKEHIHAAELAAEAGFDAVDIKVCHGYFLSELLSAYNRPGPYGGSFENRTRAILEIADGIRAAVGDRIGITIRLNAFDSTPAPFGYGIAIGEDGRLKADLTEPIKICKMLCDRGIEMINISGSSPENYLFGPDPENENFKKYISGANLLMAVKLLKEAVPNVKFMCSGLSSFKSIGAEIGTGGIEEGWYDIMGFGRQALAYPDFASDILSGNSLDERECCVCCGNCFKLMDARTLVGCVMRDSDFYLPLYRKYVTNK